MHPVCLSLLFKVYIPLTPVYSDFTHRPRQAATHTCISCITSGIQFHVSHRLVIEHLKDPDNIADAKRLPTMPGFEPKQKVDLAPPKDDPIALDYLAKCDGEHEGYPTYVAIKVCFTI